MKSKSARIRLDLLLVERGLAESRQKAQAMVLAGEVAVNGKRVEKPGTSVDDQSLVQVNSRLQKYASRGGLKLEGALQDFTIFAQGKVCLDIGSSTGGFTDCLLQHAAARVYAVDVNKSQLAWKLQQDSRVIAIEKNARELQAADIPEVVDLVVADVSFISVTKVLPPAVLAAKPRSDFLILIKPQFELRREDVGPGGIVRDTVKHNSAIENVTSAAKTLGLIPVGVKPSRLPGAEGNQEYFLHARKGA
jgi:23S rRNA (cytidine1920-2'-O)/16S rRNA (cytidine1409-2'-O)-methyltransferase